MPTFDFSNLVRAFMRLVLFTVRNPILLFGAVAAGCAYAAGMVTGWFGAANLADGWADMIYEGWESNGFIRVMFYMFNVDAFISVVTFSIRWVLRFIVFTVLFFTHWWAVNLAYTGGSALRRTIKDLG